jgi:hypothetical protein
MRMPGSLKDALNNRTAVVMKIAVMNKGIKTEALLVKN